ncbi:hypothetical protein E4L96_00090 [Massilia arenosa]|uniref:PNPLA domain-containing protein n=1 Tax=Zemynaea arenosa TaxID=2561931 RepID=A0A4Y9T097_9BURK|nr:patatin-like phospholipase family protein [Massilia arenosa]TFW30416.1 hypothetical protein E4L96_00090 [Massilia arenosa]
MSTQPEFLPTECDLVMEGGVTSGVVYPSFVARLATRFTLRSIGGASVGAVAAIAAAAAQYRRNAAGTGPGADDGAFDRLAALSAWLMAPSALGKSNLFSLFQPAPGLARHFGVLESALNRISHPRRLLGIAWGLVRSFPLGAFLGFVLALSIYLFSAYLLGHAAERPWWQIVGSAAWHAVWIALGTLLGATVQFGWTGVIGLRRNRCGVCPGLATVKGGPPALTEWLHELVQASAGLPDDRPLTFGDLEGSRPSIQLALMTTGLSELRAQRLPHASNDLVFRASDMQALFPAPIVTWMMKHARQPERSHTVALLRAADPHFGTGQADLYFLPVADQLPVVVAARMSLSFPLLMQAVRLYRLRHDAATGQAALLPVWFTDGGLTSNFPIHFFDALLPTRPTFGVSLQPDLPLESAPGERVFLPHSNIEGISAPYLPVAVGDGEPALGAFFSAILRTIRTWRDQALKRTPGYRERVVQIRHTKQEGGLNLNMPPTAIAAMSDSGTAAADAVIAHFLDPELAHNGWLNHRWVRMRSTAALLQRELLLPAQAFRGTALSPSYKLLWQQAGHELPLGYRLGAEQRTQGLAFWDAITAAALDTATVDLCKGAPEPMPTLAVTPRQT